MSRILIVEDEERIARFVELELAHEGYDAEKAADGRTGLEMAESGRFDLIILDIMLPRLSGIEVLRRLRKNDSPSVADTPVILLTARDSVTDKVSGLDMGANDYVTKPFQIEELLARIRVILRQKRPAEPEESSDEMQCCGVVLNPQSREVTYNGSPIELTNREFILLKTLMENRNVAMSREKLLCEAWGYDYFGETNIIDVYVRYIRHKTADDVIKTIRGVGYMISD